MAKKSPPPTSAATPYNDLPTLPEVPDASEVDPALAPFVDPGLGEPYPDLQPPRSTRPVELTLPWVDEELPGYTPRKVDLHLTAEQAIALRRLTAGLDACQATLDNGVRVTTGPLAVRWLLEHVGIRADALAPDAEVSDAA